MFNKTFKNKKNILIGAVHLPPLLGYPDALPVQTAIRNALKDLKALQKGGADAVIFENNYDLPHKIKISSEAFLEMALVGRELRKATKLPLGISVLWNDFESAFSLAKMLDLQFIRVPVFVDDVKTAYGVMRAVAKELAVFRKKIGAEKIMVFADIHVKHAAILSRHSLGQSARLAVRAGADAVIVTGKWTGDAPISNDLKRVRNVVGKFPILIGSGVDSFNAKILLHYANGAIVSTSLKKGVLDNSLTNLKSYWARIDERKVKKLKDSLR